MVSAGVALRVSVVWRIYAMYSVQDLWGIIMVTGTHKQLSFLKHQAVFIHIPNRKSTLIDSGPISIRHFRRQIDIDAISIQVMLLSHNQSCQLPYGKNTTYEALAVVLSMRQCHVITNQSVQTMRMDPSKFALIQSLAIIRMISTTMNTSVDGMQLL